MAGFINAAASALVADPLFLVLDEAAQLEAAGAQILAHGGDATDVAITLVLTRAAELAENPLSAEPEPPPRPVAPPPSVILPPKPEKPLSERLALMAERRTAGLDSGLDAKPRKTNPNAGTTYLARMWDDMASDDPTLAKAMNMSRQSVYEFRTGRRAELLRPQHREGLKHFLILRMAALQRALDTLDGPGTV